MCNEPYIIFNIQFKYKICNIKLNFVIIKTKEKNSFHEFT